MYMYDMYTLKEVVKLCDSKCTSQPTWVCLIGKGEGGWQLSMTWSSIPDVTASNVRRMNQHEK